MFVSSQEKERIVETTGAGDRPGQSICKPPAFDKTVYITDNAAGRRIVNEFTHSLVEHVARMQIPQGAEVTITA